MTSLIHKTAHGFVGHEAVYFGNLVPDDCGLVEGETYYVLTAGLTANDFAVSETDGGAAFVLTFDITEGIVSPVATYEPITDPLDPQPPPVTLAAPAQPTMSATTTDGVIRLLVTAEAADAVANPTIRQIEFRLSHELIDPLVPDDPDWSHADVLNAAYGIVNATFRGLPSTDYWAGYRYTDVFGNVSPWSVNSDPTTTPAAYDSVNATDTANLHNTTATVTVDDTGITILDGALTLQDEFGKSVLEASGFKGSWGQFAALGLYNGAFLAGTVGSIPNGRTSTLPYWTVSNQVGSPTLALLAAPERLSFKFAALSNKKRIVSDPVAVAPGRLYYAAIDCQVVRVAGTINVELSFQQYDKAGVAGSIQPLTLIDPNTGLVTGAFTAAFTGPIAGTDYSASYGDDVGYLALIIDVSETVAHNAGNEFKIDSASMVPYADFLYQVVTNEVRSPLVTTSLVDIEAGGYISGGTGPIVRTYPGSGTSAVTSSTWTVPAGLHHIVVEVVGGGGGGGGVTASATAGHQSVGASGGGAGYARKLYSVAALLAASYTVRAANAGLGGTSADGADGGQSDFGITGNIPTGGGISGGGGLGGGRGADRTTDSNDGNSGNGGAGTNGDVNVIGGASGYSSIVNGISESGAGGGSFFGGGASPARVSSGGTSQAGIAAGNYGGGGSGAGSRQSATSSKGGNGGLGLVIITEYYGL